jgi:hypothetical protein
MRLTKKRNRLYIRKRSRRCGGGVKTQDLISELRSKLNYLENKKQTLKQFLWSKNKNDTEQEVYNSVIPIIRQIEEKRKKFWSGYKYTITNMYTMTIEDIIDNTMSDKALNEFLRDKQETLSFTNPPDSTTRKLSSTTASTI